MSDEASSGAASADLDEVGQKEVEGRTGEKGAPPGGTPSAGPHEKPALTNPDATPGAGSLPAPSPDDEADAATG